MMDILRNNPFDFAGADGSFLLFISVLDVMVSALTVDLCVVGEF